MFDDPSALVNEFIADYFRWNDAAHRRDEELPPGHSDEDSEQAMVEAEEEYATLLEKYCRPGFQGESIAYGTIPLHDPSCETIVSVKPRGKRCVIKTTKTYKIANLDMMNHYEQHLSQTDDRWHLESVKVVMKDGKYDSL